MLASFDDCSLVCLSVSHGEGILDSFVLLERVQIGGHIATSPEETISDHALDIPVNH